MDGREQKEIASRNINRPSYHDGTIRDKDSALFRLTSQKPSNFGERYFALDSGLHYDSETNASIDTSTIGGKYATKNRLYRFRVDG